MQKGDNDNNKSDDGDYDANKKLIRILLPRTNSFKKPSR